MEHKPIYLDGVNVGGCKYLDTSIFSGNSYWCHLFHNFCNATNYNYNYIHCFDKCPVYQLSKQLARKTQECEELKKQLMQKSEVDMFFNTPIEGWSNDPCGICPHKAENEELKKEIINKNEKIKELRFSVSDLTNRLCYLNAEKSFRIVDLEQTLDGIEKELKEDIYYENQECECDDFKECLKRTKEYILDIINKAKGKSNG